MKTIVTTFFFISVLFSFAGAQSIKEKEYKKSRKLSYEDFARKYGKNDTALAIIDVFFNKRESAGTYMSFLPLSLVLTPINPLAGGMAVMITSPLFVKGAWMRLRYNKRKLSKTLLKLENSEKLTKNLMRKYKRMLVIYQIEEAELMALEEESEYR